MGLRQLKSWLRDEVMSAKHIDTYEHARSREPALANHSGVLSVLAVLGDDSELCYPEREALTRALVREHQRKPGSFWSAALILAYAPMLLRLRGRICGDALARDDLDQLVVAAFLEAVAAFQLDARRTRIAMYLRQDTQRAVFRRIGAEQTMQRRLALLAEQARPPQGGGAAFRTEHFEVFASNPPDHELDDDERGELEALVTALGGDEVPAARLEAVIATHLRGESLREYVARTHPDLDERSLETAYQRVKRERLRTVGKLRPIIEAAVHRADRGAVTQEEFK